MPLSDITATAGTLFSIGTTALSAHTKTGFEAVTWAEVGLVDDLGEFGKTYGLTTFTPVKDRGVVKRKTSFNNGSQNIRYAYAEGTQDAGQVALLAAADLDTYKPFRAILPNGEYVYYEGLVMGKPLHLGTVEDVITMSTTIEISEGEVLIEDAPASV